MIKTLSIIKWHLINLIKDNFQKIINNSLKINDIHLSQSQDKIDSHYNRFNRNNIQTLVDHYLQPNKLKLKILI
jgi:predicted solute-binding protein